MMVNQLIPAIDKSYRTKPAAPFRAVMGYDEAGYSALLAALSKPQIFGIAAAQSAFPGSRNGEQELMQLIRKTNTAKQHFYLDWGTYNARDSTRHFQLPSFNGNIAGALTKAGGCGDCRRDPRRGRFCQLAAKNR